MLRKSLLIGATRGVRFASGGHGHGPSLPKEVKVGNKVHQLVEDHHHDHKIHKTALSNGTRVMTTDNGDEIAELTFLYRDGPIYEDRFSAGASHFLRHAISKDGLTTSEFVTKTFLEKAAVSVKLPKVISRGWLGFSIVSTRDTVASVDVLDKFWQLLLFPRFSQSSIKETRRLVNFENEEAKRDTPLKYIKDYAHTVAFKGQPHGLSEFCPSYNLKYHSTKSMFQRWDEGYGFGNIAVVATNVDHHAVLDNLTASPWLARAHDKFGRRDVPLSAYKGGEGYDVFRRTIAYDDQFFPVYETYTCFAFKAPGFSSLSDYVSARLITNSIRKAVSPVLRNTFDNSKSKLEVFYEPYYDTGLFGLATQGATVDSLKGFRDALSVFTNISAENLEVQKKSLLLEFNSLADTRVGTQQLLLESFATREEPASYHDLLKALEKITTSDVQKVAKGMLDAPPTLVHHGDSPKAPTLRDL
eukprot:NODE_2254_length_1637_cov_33.895641_g1931_i0.p1 GENE.NODE_2254_length_1637_cov_33.895641_g1931_i0~~NODE_2254_length_1637_cov_33.895641_g1931_i0.p1  ORF type:complete len:488 (+),score=64.46 NODE_2254_length_1637_cov_33.895641_g1931_i0:49-1464(+)